MKRLTQTPTQTLTIASDINLEDEFATNTDIYITYLKTYYPNCKFDIKLKDSKNLLVTSENCQNNLAGIDLKDFPIKYNNETKLLTYTPQTSNVTTTTTTTSSGSSSSTTKDSSKSTETQATGSWNDPETYGGYASDIAAQVATQTQKAITEEIQKIKKIMRL